MKTCKNTFCWEEEKLTEGREVRGRRDMNEIRMCHTCIKYQYIFKELLGFSYMIRSQGFCFECKSKLGVA